MILEAKIDKQINKKTEWILESIFDEFCSILELILDQFWTKNAFKNLIKFDEKTANRVQEIRHLKYTLPALFTSRGVPLGKGWVGVRIIICRFVDLLINWNVLRGSKRLALKGWRIFDLLTVWFLKLRIFQIFGFPVRLSGPLLNQNLLKIRRERNKLRRFH